MDRTILNIKYQQATLLFTDLLSALMSPLCEGVFFLGIEIFLSDKLVLTKLLLGLLWTHLLSLLSFHFTTMVVEAAAVFLEEEVMFEKYSEDRAAKLSS